MKSLFEQFNGMLLEAGVTYTKGTIVDSSFHEAPRQRNSRDENAHIKELLMFVRPRLSDVTMVGECGMSSGFRENCDGGCAHGGDWPERDDYKDVTGGDP